MIYGASSTRNTYKSASSWIWSPILSISAFGVDSPMVVRVSGIVLSIALAKQRPTTV